MSTRYNTRMFPCSSTCVHSLHILLISISVMFSSSNFFPTSSLPPPWVYNFFPCSLFYLFRCFWLLLPPWYTHNLTRLQCTSTRTRILNGVRSYCMFFSLWFSPFVCAFRIPINEYYYWLLKMVNKPERLPDIQPKIERHG